MSRFLRTSTRNNHMQLDDGIRLTSLRVRKEERNVDYILLKGYSPVSVSYISVHDLSVHKYIKYRTSKHDNVISRVYSWCTWTIFLNFKHRREIKFDATWSS